MIALLLNHLWQSSLFVGGAGLLALALSRNGAAVRFWLWFVASVKFLVPFAVLTALGAAILTPVAPPPPAVTLMTPLAKPFSAPDLVPITISPVTIKVTAAPSARLSPAAPPARTRAQPTLPVAHIDLESALLALWAAGFLLLVMRWFARWSRVHALLRDAVAMQVDAPIAVKFSASRLEPGLVGILRPIILLPQGIEQQLSPAEMKAVLAHELSHWRRCDNFLAAIHMLVEALFWFFPLVWWLGARLNAERECACDERVLADGNDPQLYAEGILKVCRAYLQSPLTCVAGVSGGGLKQRIERIAENRLVLKLNVVRKFLLSASAAATLGLPIALALLAAPMVQMQAKAAQILLPIKIMQKSADRLLPVASISSLGQAAIDPVAPPIPQAAASAVENATLDRSGGDALTRQDAVQAETPMTPLPDLSGLVAAQTLPATRPVASNAAQPLSNATPTQLVAINGQLAAPSPVPAVNSATCAPPTLLNSLSMEPTPGGDTMTVTASFDGKPERLLVGISDTPTQLWQSRAANLRLPVQLGRRTMDGGGRISEEVSRVESFAMGNMKTDNFFIQVGPDPDFPNAGSDGILGTDMMMRYDIDLDFAHRRLNYFTPEACKSAGVYWSPSQVTDVPMKTYANVVYVPVTLDGHTLVAILDTSASRTFLNPRTASQLFGVKADGLEAGNLTDSGTLIKAGVHGFSSLTIGGMAFANPEIAVPFDVLSQSYDDSHIARTARNTFHLSEILPDIVIGMDVLKQTHVYLSYQNQLVYLSPAGDGQVLTQQGPANTSWFNVWRFGYDSNYNFRHPLIKF